jgi:exopolysaccharide biosynthesis polyprenyl glycosylphosphotransferase
MLRLRHKLFIYALRIYDQFLLIVVFLALLDIFGRYRGTGSLLYLSRNYYDLRFGFGIGLLGLSWIWIFDLLVSYQTNRLKSLKSQMLDVVKAYSAASFLLFAVGTLFAFKRIPNELVLVLWLSTCTLGMLGRLVLSWLLMLLRRSGYNYRHLLIVGHNAEALQMARRIDATPVLGYKIVGFIAEQWAEVSKPPQEGGVLVIGGISDLKNVLEREPIDEIIICLPFLPNMAVINESVRLGQELGVVVRIFPDPATTKLLSRCHLEQFEGDCVVTFFREQLLFQLLGKRLMDFFGSLLLLILLSPLLIAVAIAIKLTSPGPILFVQPRVGMNKRSFNLLKFRSMYIDAEKRKQELAHLNEMDGPVFKIKNAPRVTPLGRFIRKWSIDELPQLFNVLTGHLSLVGPRPPLLSEVNHYDWLYRKRLSIKPGITCLWQISGRNEISFKQWMELDQHYIDNWSLWLDCTILLKTIPAVLLRKGAS